jgi:hypothetical protein
MASERSWACFSHWLGSPTMWRMDFVKDPQALFAWLLTAHHEPLVVIKVFETIGRKQAELEQRFQAFHRHGRWYAPMPALRRFVEEEAVCETMWAKKEFGLEGNGRLLWRPATATKQERLEKAMFETGLPGFVKNARTFVLWAIDDVAASGVRCFSKLVVGHPSNSGVYQRKTIYNCTKMLIDEGLVAKMRSGELLLTDAGQVEINELAESWGEKEHMRTRSLKLR